jgi:serine phosphatase RsbU (regulator of sigma subunit)
LELVGGSVPAASRAAVGGDWYDALVLPDGAIGLVVGDVMGHDIEAVTAMAQLRTMVRAGAWLGHSPGHVLTMADQLAHQAGITETATVFFGRLTRNDAGAHLEYCNAGHLHPLLRDPDGTVTAIDEGSRVLLGTLGTGAPGVDSPNAQVDMPAGSILLLYTDGLVERASSNFDHATDRLIETLSDFDPSAPLRELCQPLLHSSEASDDITVFAVRV